MNRSHRPCEAYAQTTESMANNSSRNGVLLKEYKNTSGPPKRDWSEEAPYRGTEACTYCGELVSREARITIEDFNIFCHPSCFKCGICSRPMSDLIYNMFLRRGTVHCESCYAKIN